MYFSTNPRSMTRDQARALFTKLQPYLTDIGYGILRWRPKVKYLNSRPTFEQFITYYNIQLSDLC